MFLSQLLSPPLCDPGGRGHDPDYRNAEVIGAYTYVPSLDLALVLNVEVSEAQAPSVATALQLAGCSIAAVVGSMLVLYLLTGHATLPRHPQFQKRFFLFLRAMLLAIFSVRPLGI